MKTSKTPASRTDEFSHLVHLIYQASLQPEHWSQVVAAIAASFNTDKGLLFTPYIAPQHGGIVFPAGISESALQLWGSCYIQHDIWSQELSRRRLWKAGSVLLDQQMVPHQQLLESRFYREFLSKIGIARVCTGFVFENGPGMQATSLGIFRDDRDEPFQQHDVEWMKLLVPHISRSLSVMQRLETYRLQTTSVLASFDRLAFGAILLNQHLNVVHMNKCAKDVLARRDGLVLDERGCLDSNSIPSRPTGLVDWLKNLQLPLATQVHFSDVYRLRRKSGAFYDMRCSVLATHDWGDTNQGARFIVFITDPDALQLPDDARLQRLYGLTPAQSKVALALAGGSTYREAAETLAVSEDTVRSHVKEIYSKLRVNRQADLVRLVLALGEHKA